jgi:hypothetical protein
MKILCMWFTNADTWAHEIRCYAMTRICVFWFTQFKWCKEYHWVPESSLSSLRKRHLQQVHKKQIGFIPYTDY